MSDSATALKELLCNRFMVAQEATGLPKQEFAATVGITPSQLSNIAAFRNEPSHLAILKAIKEFGFTADWFYSGSRVGFRDEDLAKKTRTAAEKLDVDV